MCESSNLSRDSVSAAEKPVLYVFEESKTYPIRKAFDSGFQRLALICKEHGVLDLCAEFLDEMKRCGCDVQNEMGFKRNQYGRPHCSLSVGYVASVPFSSPEKAIGYLKQHFTLVAKTSNAAKMQNWIDEIPVMTLDYLRIQPRCKNCYFWDNKYCRINPPVMLIDSRTSLAFSAWPKTQQDDWCGGFRPKEGDASK